MTSEPTMDAMHVRRRRSAIAPLLLAALLAATIGCEPEVRVIRPSFPTFRAYADKPSRDVDPRDPTGGSGWAIAVDEFEGADRAVRAQQLFSTLRGHHLPQLWYEDVAGKTTVYSGRFASASDPEAQMALRSLAELEVDGSKPFADARLVPLISTHRVKVDPLDLQQYTGFFSLQVAVFTPNYSGDRRAAAEQRARELRAEGYEAYFYHGPHNSSVCIGLFTWDDFVRQGNLDVPGPRIRELQERFPYNIIDGQDPEQIREDPDANPATDPPKRQPSFVARVI